MASINHDFIVAAIGRKIKSYGCKIIYLDGRWTESEPQRLNIPPKILFHRPDIVGEKEEAFFCVGEAKTENDINSKRTQTQILDFLSLVEINPQNRLIFGLPQNSQARFERILHKMGVLGERQLEIIYIPDLLLPGNNEEI
jgi:hypothetical protein